MFMRLTGEPITVFGIDVDGLSVVGGIHVAGLLTWEIEGSSASELGKELRSPRLRKSQTRTAQ